MAKKNGKANGEEKKIREVKCTEFLRYNFNDEEKANIAQDLARETTKLNEATEEKKAVVAQYTEKITAAQANGSRFARQLTSGYEMRNIDCVVRYHVPKDGHKQTVRLDTGEIVREVLMSEAEKQEELFVQGEVTGNEARA